MRLSRGVNRNEGSATDNAVASPVRRAVTCVSLISLALMSSACATVTRTTVTRMALAPSPGAPPTLAGATGVGLTVRTLPAVPRSMEDKGAVAFPMMQPELSGVLKLGEHVLLSARVAGASGGMPLHQPAGLRVANGAVGVETVVGAGVQFDVAKGFGVMGGAEAGLTFAALTTNAAGSVATVAEPLPALRAALGAFYEVGPLRLYAMALASDLVGNDATSVRTTDCRVTLPCTVTETGSVTLVPLIGVGGGARVKMGDLFSLGVEAFTSTGEGTVFPLSLSFTLRVGKFDLPVGCKRKPKPVEEDGLTPPPMIIPVDSTPPPRML